MTKIQETKDNNYVLTIPKALHQALGWRKGDEVSWQLLGTSLVIKKVKS